VNRAGRKAAAGFRPRGLRVSRIAVLVRDVLLPVLFVSRYAGDRSLRTDLVLQPGPAPQRPGAPFW
jgi:hypothetical protein